MKGLSKFNENAVLVNVESSKAYKLRKKLNDGEKLTREEKDWITKSVNCNSYFNKAIPVMGWKVDFSDVLYEFIVNQYDSYYSRWACDKTSIRNTEYGKIDRIIEIK